MDTTRSNPPAGGRSSRRRRSPCWHSSRSCQLLRWAVRRARRQASSRSSSPVTVRDGSRVSSSAPADPSRPPDHRPAPHAAGREAPQQKGIRGGAEQTVIPVKALIAPQPVPVLHVYPSFSLGRDTYDILHHPQNGSRYPAGIIDSIVPRGAPPAQDGKKTPEQMLRCFRPCYVIIQQADSAIGAGIAASTAVQAGVSVDHVMIVTLRNGTNRTYVCASTAADAAGTDLISHGKHLH